MVRGVTDLPPLPGLNPLLTPLPPKFNTLRPYQIPAIMDILDWFTREKVVVLDAPTGSGKTIIAEVVRLMLSTRGIYVAHNKDLQTQFSSDFDYSSIMWGRANHLPEHAAVNPNTTCADCLTQTGGSCFLCSSRDTCPYVVAKNQAAESPVPVLNMAYWLNETRSGKSPFAHRGLTVVDEVDCLESVLMGQVSVTIPARLAKQLSIPPPSLLTKDRTYAPWARDTSLLLLSALRDADRLPKDRMARRKVYLSGLLSRVRGMAEDLERETGGWVYTGGAGSDRRVGDSIEFRPVEVARFGRERIWNTDKRFLLMSGSVVSASMLLEGLGWDGGYGLVSLESQFPAKNRPIVVRPVVDMGRRAREDSTIPRLARAVDRILTDHPDDRVLAHTVSYTLTEALRTSLQTSRPVFTYDSSITRAEALDAFKQTDNAVILAPSLDRGIDLPDDLCRVIIIVKLPFPNLGDQQISARLHTKGGDVWYQVQVARSLMQMTGRGVRHVDDYAVTYVLDEAWGGWYAKWQRLLPAWWRRAVRVER